MEIFDRQKQQYFKEKVYGQSGIELLWGESLAARTIGKILCWLTAHWSFPSSVVGMWANSSISRPKIIPFIQKFAVDASEFLDPVNSFKSFNEFFTRKLKKEVRPIDPDKNSIIFPADGRYYFHEKASDLSVYEFKGKKWSLKSLLKNSDLAKKYKDGAIVLARLAPADYHRFHFPCSGVPSEAKLVPGTLFSVNPRAIKKRPTILCENRRRITEIDTDFGKMLMLEIGATNVGSIHQTFDPGKRYLKGDEKGYFSFGGSEVILLFPPGKVKIDQDLIDQTKKGHEVRCLLGGHLGKWTSTPLKSQKSQKEKTD